MNEQGLRARRQTGRAEVPSSIGHINFIETERGRVMRRKGFITSVIETREQARYFIDDFVNSEIARLEHSPELRDVTRLTVRAIVSSDLLRRGNIDSSHIEATVRIGAINGGGDYMMVYFGYNKEGRALSIDEVNTHRRNLDLINASRNMESLSEILSSPNYHGYEICRFNAGDATVQERDAVLMMLTKSFGYSKDECDYILADPNNTIFVSRHPTDGIVGMSMAERRTVNLSDGRSMTMVEVTNATVIAPHGGNGLYGAISAHLIRDIASDTENRVDLVYSESNMDRPSLLHAIAMQQRHIAGILPNNSYIEGGLRTMGVMYLSRQELDAFYLGGTLRP